MKKVTIAMCLLFAISTVSSFAQKLEDEKIGQYSYVQLPTKPLPKEYKEYLLQANSEWNDPYRKDKIFDGFNFAGYTKKKTGQYQFKIVFTEYPYTIENSGLQSQNSTVKQDGVEKTITKYYYQYDIKYRCRIELFSTTGEIIYTNAYDFNETRKTPSYNSSNEAYNAYDVDYKKGKEACLSIAINAASNDINNTYGYPQKSLNIWIYNVKPKKFEYPEFANGLTTMQTNFTVIASNENAIADAKSKFAPAVENWNNALKEVNIEDKKARIDKDVAMAIYYNLGTERFLVKDYAAAIKFYDECIKLKASFSNAKEMKALALDLQTRVAANK